MLVVAWRYWIFFFRTHGMNVRWVAMLMMRSCAQRNAMSMVVASVDSNPVAVYMQAWPPVRRADRNDRLVHHEVHRIVAHNAFQHLVDCTLPTTQIGWQPLSLEEWRHIHPLARKRSEADSPASL